MMISRTRARGRILVRAVLTGVIALTLLGVSSPAVAAAPTLGPNLLQNGGFEDPTLRTIPDSVGYMSGDTIPGWGGVSTENGYVFIAPAGNKTLSTPAVFLAPAEGNQFIGLMGGNYPGGFTAPGGRNYSLYQEFPTEIGKTYQVSYWVAGGPNVATLCAGLLCVASVNAGDFGGGNALYFRSNYPTDSTWVQYTDTFVASKTTGVISIGAGADPGGVVPLLDGFAVQEVIPAVVDTPIASAPVVLLSITVAGVLLAVVLAVLAWRRRVTASAR